MLNPVVKGWKSRYDGSERVKMERKVIVRAKKSGELALGGSEKA
jgi:hypothetical protein